MTTATATTRVRARDTRVVAAPTVAAPRAKRPIIAYLSYGWLGVIVLLALTVTLLPISSYDLPIAKPRLTPQFTSIDLLLGTDTLGRSMLSRILYGGQVSLVVGTVAAFVGFLIGTTIGLLAGFFRGATEWSVSLLTDVLLAFPPLILLLALASVLTPSVSTLLIGLSAVSIPMFSRLARANTISWASRDFVRAAKNMGARNPRILLREILPNVLPSIAAILPVAVAGLIVAEGSLSFLGLGIPSPTPSWGGMINAGKNELMTAPHLVFIPAAVIFLTVFSLNAVGDHLRTRYDRTAR